MCLHLKQTILLRIPNETKYQFVVPQKEKEKWIKAIPNANSRASKDTVIIALHFNVSRFEEIRVSGISRSDDPSHLGMVRCMI